MAYNVYVYYNIHTTYRSILDSGHVYPCILDFFTKIRHECQVTFCAEIIFFKF